MLGAEVAAELTSWRDTRREIDTRLDAVSHLSDRYPRRSALPLREANRAAPDREPDPIRHSEILNGMPIIPAAGPKGTASMGRSKILIQTVPLVAAVVCSMGCATSMILVTTDDYLEPICISSDLPYVFMGTVLDAKLATNSEPYGPNPWSLRALAVVDSPLSLTADTVMLPVTLPLQTWKAVGWGCEAPSDEKVIIQKHGEEIQIEGEK